ncbi:hypothetical protein KW850_31370 [Bacillus sp. sid0103]|uniref:hypothetical protein n=1 Tax=Bacillus sp. sid0103 TaxID=2856337 RepID=UPI001C4672D7|nr:hypothetical protein [Bacillus sp. sid0103]MBV7509623.1 hypothetical protein [Bacillus sp. sid0103]
MRTKRIFKKTLAINLMQNGCELVKVEPNKHNPSLQVYHFELNEKLKDSLDIIMK